MAPGRPAGHADQRAPLDRPAIVRYLSQLEASDARRRLVVLIPEVQPKHFWHALLFTQRVIILDRTIRCGTANVVLGRLRYRLDQLSPPDGFDDDLSH